MRSSFHVWFFARSGDPVPGYFNRRFQNGYLTYSRANRQGPGSEILTVRILGEAVTYSMGSCSAGPRIQSIPGARFNLLLLFLCL